MKASKEASNRLEEASKGLEGGLKGATFSAEAGFEDACKGALHQRFGHV